MMPMTTEAKPYQFANLERLTSEEVQVLNRAHHLVAPADRVRKILEAVGQNLLVFDICNADDVELALTVKPVGDVSKQQSFRFTQPSIHLGRTADNQVVLKSPLVSKKHVEIFRRGPEYYIRDLKSNNGTYLNQVRLTPESEVVLKNDDVIKIEPYEISVGLPADSTTRAVEIRLHSITTATARQDRQPAAGLLYVQCLAQPDNHAVWIAIDREAARWLIQKIISGQKQTPITPWTEIETGLLEYMTARVVSTVNANLETVRLVLQGIDTDATAFRAWIGDHPASVELRFETLTENGMLYVSVYLPSNMTTSAKKTAGPGAFLKQAEWLKKLEYTFAVHAGVSMLSADQVGLLESGDIILLDRSDVTVNDNKLKGKVELRSDQLQRGVVNASVDTDENGFLKITLETAYQEGLKPMAEANKKSEGGPANDGVLAGIEIPIVIELGRLSYTLDEISGLTPGQVIEIQKPQPETVDLSVDGKVIASGKLVDVEGKLGVRILKILTGR